MIRNQDANAWSTHQLLSMAARLVERRQDRALAALGLTHAAVIALQCVANGPLNQERLAAQIKVQSQSLGKVLARLETTGLVTRTRSPVDRRSIEVAITEAGRRALDAARRAERNALPPGIGRRRTLHDELARVIDFFPDRSGSPPLARKGPQALVDTAQHALMEPSPENAENADPAESADNSELAGKSPSPEKSPPPGEPEPKTAEHPTTGAGPTTEAGPSTEAGEEPEAG